MTINSQGIITISPNPYIPLKANDILILIGTTESEKKLMHEFLLKE